MNELRAKGKSLFLRLQKEKAKAHKRNRAFRIFQHKKMKQPDDCLILRVRPGGAKRMSLALILALARRLGLLLAFDAGLFVVLALANLS